MTTVAQPPVVGFNGGRTFALVRSAFAPFGMGGQQPHSAVSVTATPTPLLVPALTPNGIFPQPASLPIFHPTPAIAIASIPLASDPSPVPVAVPASVLTVPPSSLSALRTRRESRPAKPLRGSAEVMCPNKQCGMRFASDDSLVEHLTRVHFNNRDIRKPHTVQPAVQVTYTRKSHTNGTVQSQAATAKAKLNTAARPRGSREPVMSERARNGKRPHTGTNGQKAGRQKQMNGHKKQKEELMDDGGFTDEASSLSDSSDDSSDDSLGSLDTDDSISDSDDHSSDSSSDDSEDKDVSFERFGRVGRAIASSSSSSDSDSSNNSSPRRTRRLSISRRTPVSRPPRSRAARLPSSAIDPASFSASPTAPSTASRDPRLERIHRLHYLYKYRQPLDTPVNHLRCVLCYAGLHPNLGLLSFCHGGCGLSFHMHCMDMWTVPSGPWYCSDECVREECRVKEEAGVDGRLETDLKYLQLCRTLAAVVLQEEEAASARPAQQP